MSLLELFNLSASLFTLPNNDGFPGMFPAPSFRDYLEDLIYFLRTHMPYAQDVYQNLVYKYLVAEAVIFYLFLIVGIGRFRLAQIYLLIKVPTFALLFLSSGTSYLNLVAWILCPLAYPVELLAGLFLSFWAFHRSSIKRFDKEFGGVPVWDKKFVAVKKRNGGTRWKQVEYVSHVLSQFYPDRLVYHVAFTCFYAYAKYRMILGNPLADLMQMDLQDDLDNTYLVEGLSFLEDDRGDIWAAGWTTDVMDALYHIAAKHYPISQEFHKRDALACQKTFEIEENPETPKNMLWRERDRVLNFLTRPFGFKFPWIARREQFESKLVERWLPDNRPFEWVTTSTPRVVMNFKKQKNETTEERALRIIHRNLYHKIEAIAPIPAPNLQGLSQRIVENLSTDQFTVTKGIVLSNGNKLYNELTDTVAPFPLLTWRFRYYPEHTELQDGTDILVTPTLRTITLPYVDIVDLPKDIGWAQVKPELVRSKLSLVERSLLDQPLAKVRFWRSIQVTTLTKSTNSWQKRYVEPEIRTGFTGFNFEQFAPLMELDSISNLRYGLLFILALSSLTVYSIILAGWSSNSKYAFLGALRSAAQMISYEVSISLALLPVILLSGSLNLTAIVYGQIGTVWYLFPLLPIAIVFLVSMLAETNRTPFDLPEAEAELVAGYNVDYSSLPFAMFFLGEYSNMILISVLFCLLFLGGWDGAVIALQEPYVLTIKAAVVWVFFVIVRATLPRYRYDQLMDIGWKAFLPFAGSFLVFVIGLVIFLHVAPVVEEVALEDLYGVPATFITENGPTTLATPKPLTDLPVFAFQPPEILEPVMLDYPLPPYYRAPISTMNLFNYNQRPVNSRNPLSTVLSNHLLCYPTPSSLTYNWSFGSLAGLFFALQLVTGIFLAMHYTPHVEWAFQSVEHIMTDVTSGYMFRYFHANGASAIFILIYAHMARGLYYQSYVTRSTLWITGVLIFLLMMATAFIGYVLPWGQMSFWGATVITSLVTAVPLVGEDIAYWVWGGFSVGNATLTRFFSLHFVLPFVILAVILFLHLAVLHTEGSTEPFVLPLTPSKIPFHPYYTLKDTFIFYVSLALFGLLVFYVPNLLGHSDNFLPANPLVTPAHIVPEWYFTPYYAILRACPDKIGGALGMFAAIIVLVFLGPIVKSVDSNVASFSAFATLHKVTVGIYYANFLNLIYLGSSPAAAPYIISSKTSTGIYFGYLLFVLPLIAYLNSKVIEEVEKDEEKTEATAILTATIPTTAQNTATTVGGTVSAVYSTNTNNVPPVTATITYSNFLPLLVIGGSGPDDTPTWVLASGMVAVAFLVICVTPGGLAAIGTFVSGFMVGGAAAPAAAAVVATVPAAAAVVVVAAPAVAAVLPAAATVVAIQAASALATVTGSSVIGGSIFPSITSVVGTTAVGVAITLATDAIAPARPTLTVDIEQIELENPRLPEEIEHLWEETARLPEELEQFMEIPLATQFLQFPEMAPAVQFSHLPSYRQNLWDNFHNYHPQLNSWWLANHYDTLRQTGANISLHMDHFQQFLLRGYVPTQNITGSRTLYLGGYNPTRSIEILWNHDNTQRSIDLLLDCVRRLRRSHFDQEGYDALIATSRSWLREANQAAMQQEVLDAILNIGLWVGGLYAITYITDYITRNSNIKE